MSSFNIKNVLSSGCAVPLRDALAANAGNQRKAELNYRLSPPTLTSIGTIESIDAEHGEEKKRLSEYVAPLREAHFNKDLTKTKDDEVSPDYSDQHTQTDNIDMEEEAIAKDDEVSPDYSDQHTQTDNIDMEEEEAIAKAHIFAIHEYQLKEFNSNPTFGQFKQLVGGNPIESLFYLMGWEYNTIRLNITHVRRAKIYIRNLRKTLGNDVPMSSCDDDNDHLFSLSHSTEKSLEQHIKMVTAMIKHDCRFKKFESKQTFKRFKYLMNEFDPMELLYVYFKSKFGGYCDLKDRMKNDLEDMVSVKIYLHKHKAIDDDELMKSIHGILCYDIDNSTISRIG